MPRPRKTSLPNNLDPKTFQAVIRHTPNDPLLVRTLHSLLERLIQDIPRPNIFVNIELDEYSHTHCASLYQDSVYTCLYHGVQHHCEEKGWDSLHIASLRQRAKHVLMLNSAYALIDEHLPIHPLLIFLKKHPSYIYVRLMRSDRERTDVINGVVGIRRLHPSSTHYYTDQPHILCTPCFDKLIHNTLPLEALKIPPGNWPRWENDEALSRKHKKAPFEFGVTVDSLFYSIRNYPQDPPPAYPTPLWIGHD